jgi:epoxyqueuosine reductase
MTTTVHAFSAQDLTQIAAQIKQIGQQLGFQQIGITDIDLSIAEARLQQWLARQLHGSMTYMAAHAGKRSQPDTLLPGTIRVISARIDYLPANTDMLRALQRPKQAYISRYALGRDYHKLIRKRLAKLASHIEAQYGSFGYRAFADSAPVMEKPLAEKAGLGWIGKHTNLINRKAGSWFFLGEIYTNLALPIDPAESSHCGSCHACLDICPTQAIIAPYQLDARRCISYLTIENRGPIPESLRPLIGNRIYGCDDCQIICPWNKFAKPTQEEAFQPRHGLDSAQLIDLFAWTEAEFLQHTQGSAIRRIGYECWLRNIAVALGNAPFDEAIVQALKARVADPSPLVQEHVRWALQRHSR